MSIANILSLLGGIALFLFGMSLMGDSLKKVAGNKLEYVLYHLSNTPLKGILLGTGVTAVIQSSSATSVLVVGFVNSGMMKMKQAIGIIMGAIIGTSITGWIICLSSFSSTASGVWELLSTDTLTAVIAVIGIILYMFSKKGSGKNLGGIMLGFAVLMFGISSMSAAVYPLRESESFTNLLTAFTNPFLGILIGLVFTCILQSASAAVGILQALAITGAIRFELAFPIIMGIAIGAAVPVLLSAVGANTTAKRTAFSYLLIDLIGVIIVAVLFYVINTFVHFGFMGVVMTSVSIAALNSLFRIVIILILAPLLKMLEKIVCLLIPESTEETEDMKDMDRLEERFFDHPALALEQSRITMHSMVSKVQKSFQRSLELLQTFSEEKFKKLEYREDVIDRYEDKLGTYLIQLTAKELTKEQYETVGLFLHAVTDFERIGDHALNIGQHAQELHEKKLVFSEAGRSDLAILLSALYEIIEITCDAFINENKTLAMRVEPLEQHIDELCDTVKSRHIDRLQAGICSMPASFVFNDLLTDIERASDHCSNIAIAVIEFDVDNFRFHESLRDTKELTSHQFDEYFKEYQEKYVLNR